MGDLEERNKKLECTVYDTKNFFSFWRALVKNLDSISEITLKAINTPDANTHTFENKKNVLVEFYT